MATYTFRLYCQRIDATKNMARYYALSMQPTLFGETSVVRCWGRIGKRGGEKSEVFATERDAARHFLELVRIKRAKGYRPIGACGNLGNSANFIVTPEGAECRTPAERSQSRARRLPSAFELSNIRAEPEFKILALGVRKRLQEEGLKRSVVADRGIGLDVAGSVLVTVIV